MILRSAQLEHIRQHTCFNRIADGCRSLANGGERERGTADEANHADMVWDVLGSGKKPNEG